MPLCPKCGSDNALGRIFCDSCGTKLDLTHMSSEEVAKSQARPWILRNKWVFSVAGGIIVLLLVFMAFWPRREPIGELGTLVGGDRVREKIKALSMLGPGESVELEFAESDINGYIEYVRGRSLGPRDIRVEIGSGYIHVRMIKRIAQMRLFGYVYEPSVSYDVVYVLSGNRLVPYKASMGHLSLIFKGIAVKNVKELLKEQRQWSLINDPRNLKIKDDKIVVSYET